MRLRTVLFSTAPTFSDIYNSRLDTVVFAFCLWWCKKSLWAGRSTLILLLSRPPPPSIYGATTDEQQMQQVGGGRRQHHIIIKPQKAIILNMQSFPILLLFRLSAPETVRLANLCVFRRFTRRFSMIFRCVLRRQAELSVKTLSERDTNSFILRTIPNRDFCKLASMRNISKETIVACVRSIPELPTSEPPNNITRIPQHTL
jgi:hypothetical protein